MGSYRILVMVKSPFLMGKSSVNLRLARVTSKMRCRSDQVSDMALPTTDKGMAIKSTWLMQMTKRGKCNVCNARHVFSECNECNQCTVYMLWCSIVWHGMAWYVFMNVMYAVHARYVLYVMYGIVSYGMEWHGMAWHVLMNAMYAVHARCVMYVMYGMYVNYLMHVMKVLNVLNSI